LLERKGTHLSVQGRNSRGTSATRWCRRRKTAKDLSGWTFSPAEQPEVQALIEGHRLLAGNKKVSQDLLNNRKELQIDA